MLDFLGEMVLWLLADVLRDAVLLPMGRGIRRGWRRLVRREDRRP